MSFPYVMDISFGSEVSAVGGNLPSRIVSGVNSSEDSYGPDRVEGEVFCSNIVTVYRFNSSSLDDDPVPEAMHVYYRVDLSDISEGADRDVFIGIFRNLNVTIKQWIATGGKWKPFTGVENPSTSNLSDLADAQNWSISLVENTSNFMIEGPQGSVTTSLCSKESSDPVTGDIYYSDDLNEDYKEGDPIVIQERSFTFSDK